ncbi:MAG: hypothetical protein VB078_03680 [Clostridiaceae bacterium]|nr:hypothetical protein [Clostridiaceae bacterium]
MRAVIYPSCPKGAVTLPCSKSIVHRAIFCAMAAGGKSVIENVEISDDIEATIDVCRAFGGTVEMKGRTLTVTAADLVGGPLAINCRQSAATLRFAIPFALCAGREAVFYGEGRLMQRPLGAYAALCAHYGLDFSADKERVCVNGKLRQGKYIFEQLSSSQFISGMMMGLGTLEGKSEVLFSLGQPSMPYILMTASVMDSFGQKIAYTSGRAVVGGGYQPSVIHAEADWSHAAFFAVMGAALGDIDCLGLNVSSYQGDRVIRDYLIAMGAKASGMRFSKNNSLKAVAFDCGNYPDLAPVIAAAACFADGITVISGASRLRFKESDRAEAIVYVINTLGGRSELEGDIIRIYPKAPSGGCEIDSMGDHRIAMMEAVLACGAEKPVIIKNAQAIEKSYPRFWEALISLGVRIELLEE